MSKHARRGGMSLVELLVVITIVIGLIAITLPAVISVRESARRTECGSKQSKLVLAMTRYHTARGYLPGWRNNLTIAGIPGTVSWFVEILPFLEHIDMHDGIVSGDVWSANTNSAGSIHELVGPNRCPSRPLQANITKWSMHYVANAAGASSGIAGFNKNDGVLGDNAAGTIMSLDDIRVADGLSTTLMMSETVKDLHWSPITIYGLNTKLPDGTKVTNTTPGYKAWPGQPDCSGVRGPSVTDDLRSGLSFGFKSIQANENNAPKATDGIVNNIPGVGFNQYPYPSSVHPGGAMVALVDGSTRFLTNALPPHVYGHLVTSRSVFDASAPSASTKNANCKYTTNSREANLFLAAPSGPAPYQLAPSDF